MVGILLREHLHGSIGPYAFAQVPRISEATKRTQSAYFEVTEVEHVIADPLKPANVTVSVKRVVKWPT